MAGSTERAVLAGGCFWGMQDLIRRYPGVISTRVGYTGGEVPNATYRNHGNHAEAIEIVFDPAQTSYRKLLELFFQIHDPTTRNRQGNDVGASYRSAIFFTNDEQKRVALDTIADVEASGLWPGKVVTEVVPAGPVLGGGARASRLSRALPERLHVPFCAAELGAPEAGCRGGIAGLNERACDRGDPCWRACSTAPDRRVSRVITAIYCDKRSSEGVSRPARRVGQFSRMVVVVVVISVVVMVIMVVASSSCRWPRRPRRPRQRRLDRPPPLRRPRRRPLRLPLPLWSASATEEEAQISVAVAAASIHLT